MANIHVDSQLLQHMVEAKPVDSKHHLVALRDQSNNPLLFSIGNNGRFYAIKNDGKGANISIDLSDALHIDDPIEAFAAKQATDNSGFIFLALASRSKLSTYSQLRIFQGFAPSELDTPASLNQKIIYGASQNQSALVTKLYMNTPKNSTTYPLLIAGYVGVVGNNKDANIARIYVQPGQWQWSKDIRLYETAGNLIDVCPGELRVGEGVFAVYTGGAGVTKLMFTTANMDDSSPWVTDTTIPAGANIRSISTYVNKDGYTDVLLAGDGLWKATADKTRRSGSTAERVSSDPLFTGARNLYVAQAGNALAIWFVNGEQTLGYQRATNDSTLAGPSVPLRPAGSSPDYAAIINPSSSSQSLIVSGEAAQLVLMEQAANTGIWNSRSFMVQARNEMFNINAFMTRIEVCQASDGSPLAKTAINLAASGWVNLVINGTERSVGTSAITVETDAKGTITMIQPTDDVSGYTYRLTNATGSVQLFAADGLVVDPSQKVQTRLATLATPDALRNAGATGTQQELESASKAIGQMHGLISSPGAVSAAAAPVTSERKPWDFWEWVKEKFNDIKEFIVQKLTDAWEFVVKIGQKVWSFILDTTAAIVKGVTFVLEKVGMAVKKVIEYVSYLFNWDDIKATSTSIKTLVNSALDFGTGFINTKANDVGTWFDGMEVRLGAALKVKLPNGLGSETQSEQKTNASAQAKDEKSRSVEANTAAYHFEQGSKSASSKAQGVLGELQNLYNQVLEPALQQVASSAQGIGQNIFQLFKNNKGISTDQILAELGGQVVHIVMTLLKTVVTGLMRLGSVVLQGLKDALSADVLNFGIFGGLLKMLGVPSFSILDVVAIVCAVPVTVLAKAITGQAPKRIQNFNPHAMIVEGKIDRPTALAINELAGYLEITYALFSTIVKTVKIATAEAPEEPEAFSYATLALELIMAAATYPYDTDSPGWEFRLSVWSVLLTNTIVKAVCQKAKVKNTLKIMAGADIVVALSTFALVQVVHSEQLTTNFQGKDDAVTGLNITNSVFLLVERMAGAIGILVTEPFTRLAAATIVAGCGACKGVITTGKAVIATKEDRVNYVSGGL